MGTFYIAQGRMPIAWCRNFGAYYKILSVIYQPSVAISPILTAINTHHPAISMNPVAINKTSLAACKISLAISMNPLANRMRHVASSKTPVACCSGRIGFSGVPVTVCAAARRSCASRCEKFAVDGGDSTGLGRRLNPVESGDIREELIGPIAVGRFDTLPPTAPNSEKTGLPLRQEMLPDPFRQNLTRFGRTSLPRER